MPYLPSKSRLLPELEEQRSLYKRAADAAAEERSAARAATETNKNEREELYIQLQEAEKEAALLRGEIAKKSSAEDVEAVKKQDVNTETINDLFSRIRQLEEANKKSLER